MKEQLNPCENCIHQDKAWNDEPCYRCGSENYYAWHVEKDELLKGTEYDFNMG